MNHTPGPLWIAYGQAYAGNGIDRQVGILKADRDEPQTSPTERDANIAHAVLCWNSHDALLSALKQLLRETWDADRLFGEDHGESMCMDSTWENARKAIEAAQGKGEQ